MLLPDYGRLIFRHRRASLRRLDIRDNANNLITPDKWYSEIRQGTLVLFAPTMHGYVQRAPGQKPRKVRSHTHSEHHSNGTRQTWQLVAKSIKVIDRSNETIEPRYKAALPTAAKRGTGPSAALADFKIEKMIRSE